MYTKTKRDQQIKSPTIFVYSYTYRLYQTANNQTKIRKLFSLFYCALDWQHFADANVTLHCKKKSCIETFCSRSAPFFPAITGFLSGWQETCQAWFINHCLVSSQELAGFLPCLYIEFKWKETCQTLVRYHHLVQIPQLKSFFTRMYIVS